MKKDSFPYLSVASIDQLNSLPCQMYSALFASCLDHCRVAEEQHAAANKFRRSRLRVCEDWNGKERKARVVFQKFRG